MPYLKIIKEKITINADGNDEIIINDLIKFLLVSSPNSSYFFFE